MNYEAIANAMQEEIANPLKCYMPNSPGAFVKDRLLKANLREEAKWFWSSYCCCKFNVQELDSLYIKLQALTAKESMPEWGTKGT